MSDIQWTDAQRAAFETTDRSVLVSAGAGSGKTAVLAERCARLVLDAVPPCDVDELLVVTFTEAAATEMRERVGRALRKHLADRPFDVRLRRQITLLDSARISTIHSFCRDVLNRYFAQADLDPQAPILDPLEASIMRRETIRGVFDERASRKGRDGEQFLDFLAAYGMSEDHLQSTILGVGDFLTSLPDPDEWIAASLERVHCLNATELPPFWLGELHQFLKAELTAQIEAVEQERDAIERFFTGQEDAVASTLQGFYDCMIEYAVTLTSWRSRLEQEPSASAIDDVCRKGIADYAFPLIPRRNTKALNALPSQAAVAFEMGQNAVRNIRDRLHKQFRENWGAFDTAGWVGGLRAIEPHMKTLVAVLRESRESFQTEKRSLGVIDFSDLERMTLKLLRDESNGVARRLRADIRHVLVDEFQDVNPIQAEIIRLVSREAEPGRTGNLFTVGDVKQSIYRFRLAEPRLFLDRQRAFQFSQQATAPGSPAPGRAIDLLDNFRSTRPIIDVVNAIFEKLMAADLGGIDYDEHARLKFGQRDDPVATESRQTGPALELHLLDDMKSAPRSTNNANNDPDADDAESSQSENPADWQRIEREAYAVAERIRGFIAEGRRYGDIVILLRSMKTRIHLFARTLARMGIPVFSDATGGLFDALEVRDILSVLAVLDNMQQDIPLAAALRSPICGDPLSDTDLAMIRADAGEDARYDPFHSAVRRYAQSGSDEDLRERLQARLNRLSDWRRRARRRPIADVLWEIYEESGYFAYVSGLRDGEQRRANLVELHEHARRFGEFQRQGLYRFLRYLDDIRDARLELNAGAVSQPGGDVVRIMTIHRSKGLEFPVVILAELGKQFNLDDAKGAILYDRRLGLAMEAVDIEKRICFPTLPHRLVAHANRMEMLAEELRVLYVALTRAKEKLVLVGTGKDEDGVCSAAPTGGPLALLRRRSAMSMLAWVEAALDAQPRSEPPSTMVPMTPLRLFERFPYTPDHMAQWRMDPVEASNVGQKRRVLSSMQPLSVISTALSDSVNAASAHSHDSKDTSVVPSSLDAIQVIRRRLMTPYPAALLTRVPSVVAASILKRKWTAIADADYDDESANSLGNLPGTSPRRQAPPADFREPSFATDDRAPTGARRGTLTHEFLQRLDLTRPCDAADLKAQLANLTSAGAFTTNDARSIDIGAIVWFIQTDTGRRLRNLGTKLYREWPFVLGVDPSRYDPEATRADIEDVLLVRGIIDCLFDDGDGWEVIDYKTDRVTGAALVERTAAYRRQLEIYAAAVEAVGKVRPRRSWLVFLHAREIVEI